MGANSETTGRDDSNTVPVAAFSQWPKGGKMGYNVFTTMTDGSPVRYTEWVGYKNHTPVWSDSAGSELYNHSADPNENVNVVSKVPPAEVTRLSDMLHKGWRGLV